MYQKYQTDALILRGYERGEADRVYALLTREFGFIWARASAVRRESSRMRYALQTGARSNVSLVRGKRGWRLAGATAGSRIDPGHGSAVSTFTRIGLLLERLSPGEETNEYLFDTLSQAHEALTREPREAHATIELVSVARMLYALGYLSIEALGSALFVETAFAPSHFQEAQALRPKLLSSVNKALSETQL